MSLVGFSFGSLGDIYSALDLALKVRKALTDSAGASEEYQALLAEVDSFYGLLQTVSQLLSSSRTANPLPASVVREIRLTIASSMRVLAEIEGAVVSYKGKSEKGSYVLMMEESWRKIGWAVLKQRDVADMQRRLAGYLNRILALLCVLQR